MLDANETTSNGLQESDGYIKAPATITTEQADGSRDDAYIFNFTNNPKGGKAAALRATGWEGEYLRQEAYRMHNRLRLKIQAVVTEINRDLGTLANFQLNNILNMSVEETGIPNMLGAIKMANDVVDTKPSNVIDDSEVMTIEQIDAELALLEDQGIK